MPQRKIKVKMFKFDPAVENEPHYKVYEVPLTEGMSVLDVLDYIYENIDSSIAYYDHAACRHGLCSGCIVVVNGKTCLACQTPVSGDITIEPPSKFKVIRDLVYTSSQIMEGQV
jgi:succinate dehydrogenase/fumarate reductase iron-sulfur protein